MPARALWYAVAALMVAGIPLLVYLLFGAPELAAPSQWADVESGIADGVLPAGYIVNIISGLFLVAWFCGLGLLVATLTGRMPTGGTADEEATAMAGFAPDGEDADPDFEPGITAGASDLEASMPADSRELAPDRSLDREPGTEPGTDPDEPWYRQGPPLFDEPFSDEYPRVVVPPDDATPDEPPDDPAWPAGAGTPESPITDDGITDAEIVSEPAAAPADDPPMIVPVRAYYFTRAEDTLRSIAAQFLQTPKRWEELRGLNAASPGVAGMGPDTLLPVGTALALPGDPLPWGKPDPVYLWTLAEKFLFTAWGREPAPEEVVPFWRGLTSGSQLGTGTASDLPLHLAAATAEFPAAETGMPVPPTPEPEPPTQEPETPTQQEEPPAREPEALTPEPEPPTHETVEAPTPEPITAYDSPEDAPTQEREPATQPEAPTQEQITAYDSPEPPPTYERPAYESPVPTDYESPAPPTHCLLLTSPGPRGKRQEGVGGCGV
ncbi:MAG: hypothetical protein F4X38_06110, partial [Acidimicrobiaceae bacterium]|nr:hypothetical protein [Acidimicrobiaceae bacterium]